MGAIPRPLSGRQMKVQALHPPLATRPAGIHGQGGVACQCAFVLYGPEDFHHRRAGALLAAPRRVRDLLGSRTRSQMVHGVSPGRQARALADPSAVVDAAMTRPEVQAALIGWLPSQPNLEKVDWETVLRETEKGTAAWCAVQILGLMMRRRQLEPTGTDPQARDVMLVIESIWDELRDEAENGNPNERVICKHLTKLGRSQMQPMGFPCSRLLSKPCRARRRFARLRRSA